MKDNPPMRWLSLMLLLTAVPAMGRAEAEAEPQLPEPKAQATGTRTAPNMGGDEADAENNGIAASRFMSAPPEASKPRLVLEVLLVNDPDFPEVTQQAADVILSNARFTLGDKLGFPNVDFRIKGTVTVADFIARNLPPGNECSLQFEPLRALPGSRSASQVDPALVDQFLSRWSVESLAAFFPINQRENLTSYEAIRGRLLEEFDRKLDLIASYQLGDGKSLLDPSKLSQRSYVNWICAVRNQNEADFILTNEFILYDLASEPYAHSIFAKCKVGGASLLSPERRAIHRRALIASTFSMVTDLPFFQEDGVEWLTTSERFAVIGTFIVAHEMGHAVFKIPDFYDHPPECLMTTKFETGYVSGFRELKAHPGPCPKCQPYVDAKRHVFLAQNARAAGNLDEAISNLKMAIGKTPKHVDGSYPQYLADLSVQIAEAYAAKGDVKQARRWLKSAVRVVPKHAEAAALKHTLDTQ